MAPSSSSSFLKNRISAISQLSSWYRTLLNDEDHPVWFRCSQENAFFTEDSIRLALATWADALTESELEEWVAAYPIPEQNDQVVGIVAAGNIPLVGLHDVLCVLLAGYRLQVKPSSSDRYLMVETLQFLEQLPEFSGRIAWVEKLSGYHKVIATGSNNTNRYFEVYYIVSDKCTECQGFHEEPQCAAVCPVDCCIPDALHKETEEQLLAKKAIMHP